MGRRRSGGSITSSAPLCRKRQGQQGQSKNSETEADSHGQSTFRPAGTTSLPLDMIGLDRSTTPTGAPAFDGKTLNVTWSPGTNIFRVQPCPDRTPGEFSSPAQCITLPLSSFTSK